MTDYPQLATGALTQFPAVKKRRARTVVNQAADGSSVKYADPAGETVEWHLRYAGISDDELAAIEQFFASMEGSLNTFTFLDPSGNLLAWSEDLTNTAWSAAPYLSLAGAVTDPLDGASGWHIDNSGAGAQALTQTLNVPLPYTYCFSVYARSTQAMTIALLLGSHRVERVLDTNWRRIWVVGSGDPAMSVIVFGIELPAGSAIDLFGPQVEPQRAPSAYKTATTGGVYQGARFRDDELDFTTTDVNQHTVTINIFYAKHL